MLRTKDKKLIKTLYKYSLTNNEVDDSKVKTILNYLEEKKPVNLYGLLKGYKKALATHQRKSQAAVESAVELQTQAKEQIEMKLKKDYSSKLKFSYTVNQELLGGIKITVGDDLIDYSLTNKFDALKEWV